MSVVGRIKIITGEQTFILLFPFSNVEKRGCPKLFLSSLLVFKPGPQSFHSATKRSKVGLGGSGGGVLGAGMRREYPHHLLLRGKPRR